MFFYALTHGLIVRLEKVFLIDQGRIFYSYVLAGVKPIFHQLRVFVKDKANSMACVVIGLDER